MDEIPEPTILTGKAVRLEPLSEAHIDDLYRAGRDEKTWAWLPRGPFSDEADASRWLHHAMQLQSLGDQVVYAIVDIKSHIVVGMTRIMDVHPEHKSVEIGWTWIAPKFQRTTVNMETKLLLLSYLFDDLHYFRVFFKTDKRNKVSQKALVHIGATKEGTFRSHQIMPDGHRRDSVFYSILDHEWGDVKKTLKAALNKRGA